MTVGHRSERVNHLGLEVARLIPEWLEALRRYDMAAQELSQVGNALLRPQFGLCRLDWGRCAEFHLPHGELLRLLRSHGFMVEDLIEIQAPREAHRDYPHVSADWAHNWPSEEIWKTRLAG